MKKVFLLLSLFVSTIVWAGVIFTTQNSSEPQSETELLVAEWFDDDIKVIKNTTAYYWSGNYATNWMSCDARIGKNRNGSYVVEIHPPLGDPFVCSVEENPDYTGGYSGGRRTYMTHRTTCRSTIYYFDL